MLDTGILLESGTNEFEVLIFNLNEKSYGVNVAKVREIISTTKFVHCPGQPSAMLGVINQRGTAVPLISLHRYFEQGEQDQDPTRQVIVVTEFSKTNCAFMVDSVEQIVRASWKQIHPLPEIDELHAAKATGLLMIEDRLVPMVDFEWIYAELFPKGNTSNVESDEELNFDRSAQRVYIVDDSPAIRGNISRILDDSGYNRITAFSNGQACWDQLELDAKSDTLPNIVVTDIEMPLMDGLALTRTIKEDARTGHLPVILFSSLITDDNRNKGEQVGADAQLAKPMIADVVRYADQLIAARASQPQVAG